MFALEITKDILYIGTNDHDIDLFEGQYPVPNGVSYNSYLITDEKIAVMDTVDHRKALPFLQNLLQAERLIIWSFPMLNRIMPPA